MKINVTEYMFHDAFIRAGRGEQFSREARSALFNYLEELEQDTGEEWELDVVGICCDWTEYDTAREAAEAYGWEVPERDKDCESDAETSARIWLDNETHVVEMESGGVVILQF